MWKMIVACVKRKVELVYVLFTMPQSYLEINFKSDSAMRKSRQKICLKDKTPRLPHHIAAILSPISI